MSRKDQDREVEEQRVVADCPPPTLHETHLERFDEEFRQIWIENRFPIKSIKHFITQCRIEQLQKDIARKKKLMEAWTRELGTDKHNGQLEVLLEEDEKELLWLK